jgi:hypothetical protein
MKMSTTDRTNASTMDIVRSMFDNDELVNDDDIVLQDLLDGNYSLPLEYYYAIGNFGYGTTGIRFQSKSARNEFVAFGVADLRRAVTLSVAKKYGITRDM